MASRRMFHIDKIQTDSFLYLIPGAQCLFFHCMLTADDDGFVARPLALARMVGCSREHLEILIREGFLMQFKSGVVLIKHWRIHNCIRHDRYHASILPERNLIGWDETGEYHLRAEHQGLTTYADLEMVKPKAAPESPQGEETVQEETEETIPATLPAIDLKPLITVPEEPETQPEKAPVTEPAKEPGTTGKSPGAQWEPEVRSGKARIDYDRQSKTTTLLSEDPASVWCVAEDSTISGKNDVRPDDRTVTPGALGVLQQALPNLRYTVVPKKKEA